MAKYNRSVAPYYDDYDSSKNYTHLVAVPGRVAQAREITQIQSVVKDIVKSVGDSILRDGNIVEGCQVIVSEDKTSVTVTEGKVYINGMVLPVAETSLAISGEGTETIGVQLNEILITENEDATLRDPAQGYDNYNQPGCYRIKSSLKVVINEDDAVVLTTLIDGDISVEKYAPDYDTLTQTLARRTYDESGSYIVDGLKVRVEANTNTNKFNVVVEEGKAYVLGYELRIPSPRKLTMDRSLTFTAASRSHEYDEDIQSYSLSEGPYVKGINSVSGRVQRQVNMQAPSTNTSTQTLDDADVRSIVSISGGYTFSNNSDVTSTDCSLVKGVNSSSLRWNGHNAPTGSFNITYTYKHTFVQDTDYELELDSNNRHRIKWLAPTVATQHPLDETEFDVSYESYLARKDTVYMDQYGNIEVIEGRPDEYGFETIPSHPLNTLPLAYISSPPGGSITTDADLRITVSNVGLTRFTMNDIQSLLDRVKTLEYDQAVLSLNDEAKQYTTTNSMKGIFTDPLIDFSKIDFYYNLSNGVALDASKPIHASMVDLDSNMCYLPVGSQTLDAEVLSSNGNSYGRILTLGKTGESYPLSQMNATKAFKINPYSAYPQLPEVSLTPAVDNWIDDTIITVPVSKTEEVINTKTQNVNVTRVLSGNFKTYTTTNYRTYTSEIGTRYSTSTESTVLSEEPITYIRQRDIRVSGSNYPPNLDNIKCHFDGIQVTLTPTGDTVAGTSAGSIKSDNNGNFTAKFTIPEKVLTGIREVLLSSDTQVEGYVSSAFALYQASGISRTIQNTVTSLTTVLITRTKQTTTTTYVDPVGQTFVLDKMTIISGIDLYFRKKSTSAPVTCEIREVVNGTITSTIYGQKTLSASQVSISSDGRGATRFTFEDPVLLEANKEYAFVIRSTSTEYEIWVANLGENDIVTGKTVLTNPYLIGVMMSSSNNSSWTNHQTMDVKFRLVADTYSENATITFKPMTPTNQFSRIFLLADAAIPVGTSVRWYYSVDSGATYLPITTYDTELLGAMKSTVQFRAVLDRNSETNLSPLIALDSICAHLSYYELEGYYITKTISGLSSYTTVDVLMDTYTPANTDIKVYVSSNNGTTLTEATASDSKPLNYGWREITSQATISSATQCKIFIKMTSDYKYNTPAFRRLRVIMS